MSSKDETAMMETLYWWGVPTLFRAPLQTTPADCDIALIGVPHSTGNGTTERDQHLGPRALRDVSAAARRVHLTFGFSPWEACRICDLGDVPLPEANNNEQCIARISDFYADVDAAGARPVSVGGDHSISGGILSALGGGKLANGERVALVQFDAHTDVYDNLPHFLGAKKSAAHWAGYLVRDGKVDPSRSTQIGIRGNPRSLDWLTPARDIGYELVTKEQCDERGVAAVAAAARARAGDAPVYISFDLDCLDPSIAPAVSNLEAGEAGFMINEAMTLLRGLRGANIIGGDIVCMMPTKDNPNKITALTAAAIMFEIIALIADQRKNNG